MTGPRLAAPATFAALAVGALVAFALPFVYPTRRPLRLPGLTVTALASGEVRLRVPVPADGRLRVAVRAGGREIALLRDEETPMGRLNLAWRAPRPGIYTVAVELSGVRQPYRERRAVTVPGPGAAP